MAIKIEFDGQYNPEQPTFVLSTKNGSLLGKLQVTKPQVTDNLNSASEIRFDVYKPLNPTAEQLELWDNIVELKTVWSREWNEFFEISVEVEEAEFTVKHVTAKALGESELSQIMLYNMEINTEDDIARDDYEPTVLYDGEHPNKSLLNRLLEKAPHYSIKSVDVTIKNIQRTFSFDGKSIYDALMEVSEEYECLFVIRCYLDSDRIMRREISAYDLLSYCSDCGYRGSFTDTCPECGGTNIIEGYGEDTTIFINSDNLANNIKFTTDGGSVKNCFKLKCGDDYMTAAVAACNPNGSPYIYYITDDVKADMSEELVTKLNDYDALYQSYQTTHTFTPSSSTLSGYNGLITKYSTSGYNAIPSQIVGYSSLMQSLYGVIGFYYYLDHELMPTVTLPTTTASAEAAKFTVSNIGSVAVKNISSCTLSTANSAVLHMVKTLIDNRYDVKINGTPTYNSSTHNWTGGIKVTNRSDEEDTANSSTITLTITGDYTTYVQQCITRALNDKNNDDVSDMVSLFKLSNTAFENELKKYGLTSLTSIHDACQGCVDILISQGVADGKTWGASVYNDMYSNGYYYKLGLIEEELKNRESEIEIIQNMRDLLSTERDDIHEALDFENYLGTTLFLEFCTYRREDTYQNDNYISDGLNDAEIFANALDFLKTAKNEIYKSAELQHSITASLKNLLMMKEFKPIVDYFSVGNWIRVRVDDKIYKLRLLNYEVDFDSTNDLSVTFTDLTYANGAMSDIENILNSASNMATSYSGVKRQAKKGDASNDQLEDWVEKGLALTTMKIVNNADNQDVVWDEHGILCREYMPFNDTYSDQQIKIINSGLYFTDNNWRTSKAGIGSFYITNPATGQLENRYGVIADTVVGRIILGEEVYIANTENTFTVDTSGVSVSNGTNSVLINPSADYLLDVKKGTSHLMYLDANGDLNVTGHITANSLSLGNGVKVPYSSVSGTPDLSVYISKGGTVGSTPSDGVTGFKVSTSGLLQASNAVIYGTIYASDGTIGGWNISNSYLQKYTSTNTSVARYYAGMKSSTTSTDWAFSVQTAAAGSTSWSIPFRVNYDGSLISTKGNIAGWDISSTSLAKSTSVTSGTATTQYRASIYAPSSVTPDSHAAFSTSKRSYDGSSYGSWSYPFYVRYDGYLYASNANITGTISTNNITATGGEIGGWTLGSNSLYHGTFGTSGSMLVCAGGSTSSKSIGGSGNISGWTFTSGANFGVTKTGDLYASSAVLNGSFTNVGSTSTVSIWDGVIQIDRSAELSGDAWNGMWLRYVRNGNTLRQNAIRPASIDIIDYDNYNYEFYASPTGVGLRDLSANKWRVGFNVSSRSDGGSLLYSQYIEYTYSCAQSSDRRLKENITPIRTRDALQRVLSWNPVRYKYIDNNGYHHGFIAQDIEDAKNDDAWEVVMTNNETGYKSLSYTELIADLVVVIKDLNRRIDVLESMLEE